MKDVPHPGDTRTVSAAVEVLEGRSRRRGLAPRAAVPRPGVCRQRRLHRPRQLRHEHPGAQFDYLLIWVVVASNLTAMLVQALSATGHRHRTEPAVGVPRPLLPPRGLGDVGGQRLVAMAADLAEFLGAALGF